MASKRPLEVSEVPEDMERLFVKWVNICESAREESDAQFGKRGHKEDHHRIMENKEAHFKNEYQGKREIIQLFEEGVPKNVNLEMMRVWTLKPSKIVQTLKPPHIKTNRKLS